MKGVIECFLKKNS